MPQRTPTLFRKSCLAAATAALTVLPSACSTLPGHPGGATDDASGPASGSVSDEALFEAGLETRDVGERNWDRVMYLLGFSEEAKRASRRSGRGADQGAGRESAALERGGAAQARDEPVLFDEVDWALMEEDAPMPGSEPDGPDASGTDTGVAGLADAPDAGADERAIVVAAPTDADTLDEETAVEETAVDADALQVGSRALSHEVGERETLWDIAKLTTGDATNWHVLADVNDLAPDAAVYPGQILTIPADLVRSRTSVDASTSTAALRASPPAGPAPTGGAADDVASATSNGVSPDGTSAESDPIRVAAAMPGRDFDLAAGETLWDFAKRTTGDATNWRAIADANGFTDDEASLVRAGQTITVPLELVREPPAENRSGDADAPLAAAEGAGEKIADASDGATAEAGAPGVDADAVGTGDEVVIRLPDVDAAGPVEPIPNTSAQDGEAGGGADANALPAVSTDAGSSSVAPSPARSPATATTARLSSSGEADERALRVVDAAYRSGTGGTEVERDGARPSAGVPERIMVSGTYYPKAVYNDADFSSSLLMRVSPGTTLQVSRAVGPWFEVQTDQGPGYVHTRDIK